MSPWKNFSFVIPGRLAGMRYPGDDYYESETGRQELIETLERLKQNGISAMVSLCEIHFDIAHLQKFQFEHLYVYIHDLGIPTLEQTDKIIAFINRMFEQNRAVVVHCLAGQGRTGTILASYLVSDGYSAMEAIQHVRMFRPGSIESNDQEEFIFTYEAYCKTNKRLQ